MEQLQQLFVPAQVVNVVKHGAGGVGIVGCVDLAAGQLPDQPGIHGAEEQVAPLCLFPGTFHIVENPLNLAGREVGIGNQTRDGTDVIAMTILHHTVDDVCGTAALPDDGIVNGTAGALIPNHGGFTLVGDADAGDFGGFDTGLGNDLHHHRELGGVDLLRVVLHPALTGIELGEFFLGDAYDILRVIEQNGAGTGSALIQCKNVFTHTMIPQPSGKIVKCRPAYPFCAGCGCGDVLHHAAMPAPHRPSAKSDGGLSWVCRFRPAQPS